MNKNHRLMLKYLTLFIYAISILGSTSGFFLAPPLVMAQDRTPTHTSHLYISVNGRSTIRVDKPEGGESTQTILVSDYLSSTKAIISQDGSVVSLPSYYPYGSAVNPVPLAQTDKQYTGQKKASDDSSVYNYNARYYNPATGIFIQPDSVQGPARYTYVAGNPVMAGDPSGNDYCQQDPGLSFFWSAIGLCDGAAKTEDFMDSEGLNSVGQGMAILETASGIGGIAIWLGDKANGDTAGSETIDSAYSSLSGGAAAGLLAVGMLSPDIGDAGRGVGFLERISRALRGSAMREVHVAEVAVRSVPKNNFTVNYLDNSRAYAAGIMSRVYQWEANPGRIEPFLKKGTGVLPKAKKFKGGYERFKEMFAAIYGQREYNKTYSGLFARIAGEDSLRISVQDPGIVKHGMLTGGAPADLAGEFTYGWTRDKTGQKQFHIWDVNLSSGGYMPREYGAKLDAARKLLINTVMPD